MTSKCSLSDVAPVISTETDEMYLVFRKPHGIEEVDAAANRVVNTDQGVQEQYIS